jgi:hypothetical protein
MLAIGKIQSLSQSSPMMTFIILLSVWVRSPLCKDLYVVTDDVFCCVTPNNSMQGFGCGRY